MELHSRLFQMMKSGDASQPGFPWFMVGVASRGKVSVQEATPKGWMPVAGLAVVLTPAMALIWGWGFVSGVYSLEFAATATFLIAIVAIAGTIRLLCTRMIDPRASDGHPR